MIAVAVYTLLAGFYPTVSLRPERAQVRFVPPDAVGAPGEPYAGDPDAKRSEGDVSSDWPERSDPRAAQAPPAAG
jgi:hypothetical protein